MRRRLLAVLLTAGLAAGGCGGEEKEVVQPKVVAAGLVPRSVHSNELAFHETAVEAAKTAFAEAGPNSLAADGRVWELRLGDRLVGVLQLTTLMPEVDLLDDDHRNAIVRQLLPSVRDRIDVGDIAVWTATAQGKTTFLWFGDDMFALLTVKPGSEDPIDPETAQRRARPHGRVARVGVRVLRRRAGRRLTRHRHLDGQRFRSSQPGASPTKRNRRAVARRDSAARFAAPSASSSSSLLVGSSTIAS